MVLLWEVCCLVYLKKMKLETNNKTESFGEILQGSTPVLVDFTAEWCGPCKMMKPMLKDLHDKMGDKLRIIKVDIDKSPAAANAFNVQSVPTLMLFQNGKSLWRQSGVLQTSQLVSIIQQYTILS